MQYQWSEMVVDLELLSEAMRIDGNKTRGQKKEVSIVAMQGKSNE